MTTPVEIIPSNLNIDRLYWVSDTKPPRNRPLSCYICIDNDLVYESFCKDFGPLNLAMTYRFCIQLQRLLQNPRFINYQIYHYTTHKQKKRANAAYLIGAFQVLVLQRTAEEAWSKLDKEPMFLSFRDASSGECYYQCTILHCLKALERAVSLKWFDLRSFNLKEYEYFEKVENGDHNWIIPGKLLAFSSPASETQDYQGLRCFTPDDYVPLFKRLGVSAVIRLNKKTYSCDRFIQNGIRHYDLYFQDGSVPDFDIIDQFLEIIDSEPGAVAVHCKAGLGRTGTLIGSYAIYKYNFPPEEFIAWARICRPGSVLGPQQQFLIDNASKIKQRIKGFDRKTTVQMSPQDKVKAVFGDNGQAERLIEAKRSRQCTPVLMQATAEGYRPSSAFGETRTRPIQRNTITPTRNINAYLSSIYRSHSSEYPNQ